MANREVCCVVCEEQYSYNRTPHNLDCGHTYCNQCLDQVLGRQRRCPECRAFIRAATSADLPVSYALLRLCSSSTSNIRTRHRSSSLPLTHSGSQPDAGLCSEHGSLLLLRCQTCQVWACQECQTENHPECKLLPVVRALDEARETSTQLARSALLKLSRLEEKMASGKSLLDLEWRKHVEKISCLRAQIVDEKKALDGIKLKTNEMDKFGKELDAWGTIVKAINTHLVSDQSPQEAMLAIQMSSDYLRSVVLSTEEVEQHLQPFLPGPKLPKIPSINTGRDLLHTQHSDSQNRMMNDIMNNSTVPRRYSSQTRGGHHLSDCLMQ
ncbi:uncharacterized protein [Panulirus ornatus]